MRSREDKEFIENCESVCDMTGTDGWKLIKMWIEKRITSEIEGLTTCRLDDVTTKRANIQTFKSVLLKVDEMAEKARGRVD